MSHVKKLIEKLENKIKEQTGGSPSTGNASPGGSGAAALPPRSTPLAASKAAPRTITFTSPEEFHKKQKESETSDKMNRMHAKQMAARYNMTYRTLELKALKEEERSNNGAGSRRASVATRRASVAQRRYSAAVGAPGASASSAGTASAPPRRRSSVANRNASANSNGASKAEVSIPSDGFEVYNAVEADAFWMTELAIALAYEDEGGINRAILQEFFEEHDPDRVEEIDALLKEWEGREDELFAHISLTYMGKQAEQNSGRGDMSAEQTALAVFEASTKELEEEDALLAKAIEESKKLTVAEVAEAVAIVNATNNGNNGSASAPKPRRTSVIDRIVLNSGGGIKAAELASLPVLGADEAEEKVDEHSNAGATHPDAAKGGASSSSASAPMARSAGKSISEAVSTANPYIISGLAQEGQVWIVNVRGPEENRVLRERMLATGHTEDEVKAVMQDQSGLL